MSPLKRRFSSRRDQRGAIGLIAAGTLSMALLCMLVVLDSGRLYLEKRSLQRVADVSALEVASRKGTCAAGTAITYATQSAARNGFNIGIDNRTLTTTCGALTVGADSRRVFGADPTQSSAIQVVVTHSVPRSIAAGIGAMFDSTPQPLNIQLSAVAVAAVTPPVAALTIRSTLLTINSSNASILNPLIGGLLGGSLNLSVAGWQGLASGNINLLSYLDQLKIDLNIKAVDYTQVLGTNVAVSQLIQTAINVLDPNGTLTATATIASLQALKIAAGATQVVLGNLINVQGGTNIAGLDVNLQLPDLIQGFVQLANKQNGIAAQLPINLAGLAKVTATVKVIQPPQLSAAGDPSKINPANPLDANRIYVRTAQVRTLLSVELPLLQPIGTLVNAVTNLLGPLSNTLNNLLNLNLVGTLTSLGCLLGAVCEVPDLQWLSSSTTSTGGPSIQINIDAASAESYVTGYTCASNTNKTLTTNTNSSLLTVNVGQIDPATAFPAATNPTPIVAAPFKILDIGINHCSSILGLPVTCGTRTPSVGGGIGISLNVPVGQVVNTPYTYRAPAAGNLPEINQPPYYPSPSPYTTSASSLLSNALAGIQVNMYKPTTSNLLGDLLSNLGTLLNGITTALNGVITSVVSPLLGALLDPLLKGLGINMNEVDVGANLSCNIGQATLVI